MSADRLEDSEQPRGPVTSANLQLMWRDGVASGDAGPLDAEDIKRRGCERLVALRSYRDDEKS